MAIILGGNGVDTEVAIGTNLVLGGLVFHIDPADSNSLVTAGNVALTNNVEIDYIYGLLGDTQQVRFTANIASLPYYQSANQGYINIGNSTSQNGLGTLSKQLSLGSSYTIDVWVAPRVNTSYDGANWIVGDDTNTYNSAVSRTFLSIDQAAIGTYGYSTISTNLIKQAQWINVTVVVFPPVIPVENKAFFYVNGKFIGATSKTLTTSLDTIIKTIGGDTFSTGGGADGDMGPIKAYNRALSAQEVLQNYNAMKSRYII